MEESDVILYAQGLLKRYPFFCVGNIDKHSSEGNDYFLPIFYCPGRTVKISIEKYVQINKRDIADYKLPTEKVFNSIRNQYIGDYFNIENIWITEEMVIRPYDVHLELSRAITDIMELNEIPKKIEITNSMRSKVAEVLRSTERLMYTIKEIAISNADRIFISQFVNRDTVLLFNLIRGYYHHHFDGSFSIVRNDDLDEIINLYKTLLLQIYSYYYSLLANANEIEDTVLENAPAPDKLSKEKIDFINPFLNKETVLVLKDLGIVNGGTIINGIKSYSAYIALVNKINYPRLKRGTV